MDILESQSEGGEPNLILSNLYLGNVCHAQNKQALKELNISGIVNTAKEIENFYPEEFEVNLYF